MLRNAARLAVRRGTIAQRLAPVAAAARHVGLKTLAPTTPTNVEATTPTKAAAADTASTPVPPGKISQIIGAVVDVKFGKPIASSDRCLRDAMQ